MSIGWTALTKGRLNRSDIERVSREIALAKPHDIEQSTIQAYRWYSLASLGGKAADFASAERFTNDTLARFGPREDLCLLKANLDFTTLSYSRQALAATGLTAGATVSVGPLVYRWPAGRVASQV